jgi:hypothetical protein
VRSKAAQTTQVPTGDDANADHATQIVANAQQKKTGEKTASLGKRPIVQLLPQEEGGTEKRALLRLWLRMETWCWRWHIAGIA